MLRSRLKSAGAAAASLLPLLLHGQALADSAVYYSPLQNAYGWCSGYSHDRALRCARSYCDEWHGNDCALAVACDGGWGAVAMPNEPAKGIGVMCGVNGSTFARYVALASCMAVTRDLCWTATTFDNGGNSLSESSNRDFDMAWYAQVMLQLGNYELGLADGELGPATRAALAEFQSRLGRQPNGLLDDELFWRLVDSVGGVQRFVRAMQREVLDKERPEFGDVMYGASPAPLPALSFSEQLMQRSPDDRRMALATLLSSSGTRCTLPARDARALDASTDVWQVDCAEGTFTLMMDDGSWTVVSSGNSGSRSSGSGSDDAGAGTGPLVTNPRN